MSLASKNNANSYHLGLDLRLNSSVKKNVHRVYNPVCCDNLRLIVQEMLVYLTYYCVTSLFLSVRTECFKQEANRLK